MKAVLRKKEEKGMEARQNIGSRRDGGSRNIGSERGLVTRRIREAGGMEAGGNKGRGRYRCQEEI
jgi:hypothetical protein